MSPRQKPEKLLNLISVIRKCIDEGRYTLTLHALERQVQRKISLPATLHVLKNGYEEKRKSSFDLERNTWKYAIRGKTLIEKMDVRVVIAFDDEEMLIITVIHLD